MSLIPKSLNLTSYPALLLAGLGRKIWRATGIRCFRRLPISFGGVKMGLTPEAADGFRFWAEMFDDQPYPELISECASADLLIDCGGNTGAVTCGVLSKHPNLRALTFEPNPPTFQRLEANCRLNGLSSRVTLMRMAAGSSVGTVAMESDPANSMAVAGLAASGAARSEFTVDFPLTTVDAAVAELTPQPGRIVMKIDVEGFEVEVLRGAGATLQRTSHVAAECHSESLLEECRGILLAAGFACESKVLSKGYWGLYGKRP